ncbi:MAG: alcohol dehydrogenase catalytic domain-containing protein, partial [Pseudomonadota bacterium]
MGEMMQAIEILDDKSLGLTQLERPEPKAGEIRIAIKAAGLNRADLVQRAGRYPPPPGAPQTMGLECAGTIEEIG